MKIYDTNKNLIAVFKKYKDIKNSKNFLTDNKDEFQFGTFNLEKGDEIKRHIHYEQPRNIYGTSEAIVVLDGSLKVSFFDNDKKFIDEIILNKNDSLLILSGGHSIDVLEDTKFVEFKQGPYVEEIDKEYF